MNGPDTAKIEHSLSSVYDPELNIPVTDLGLIYGIEISDGNVIIDFTLTSPGCPLGNYLENEIVSAVSSVDGVKSVKANLVWKPYWGPERMTDAARLTLGYSI